MSSSASTRVNKAPRVSGWGWPSARTWWRGWAGASPWNPKKAAGRRSRSICWRWARVTKILIVEDDPAVRDVVKHALSREGMETMAVGDGEAAIERLRREAEPFDLVVLDIMLPGMDGIGVCREIRAGEAGSASSGVPIFMPTPRDDETSGGVGLEGR